MATENYISNDFYGIPASFNILANAARKNNPESFKQSAGILDMTPSLILRGLAYSSFALSLIPDDDVDPRQMNIARTAIAELTELMACLIDHQNAAAIDKICEKERQAEAHHA